MTGDHSKTDLLILGAGWTSTFLIPLCQQRGISFAATSRAGRNGTLPFQFNPDSEDDLSAYEILPHAATVLITFPIEKKGGSGTLVKLYKRTHGGNKAEVRFIQLGTTGIWGGHCKTQAAWYDRHSPFDSDHKRALAEQELLALSPAVPTTVLNLSGLWGGSRSMRNYVKQVAPTKDVLRIKSSLHMIHGSDVANAILAVHHDFNLASGQRWLLTDTRVYDWWDLISAWGTNGEDRRDEVPEGPQPEWVMELMDEEGVRALPREMAKLGRLLDSRDFWTTFKLVPTRARLE